MLQEADCSLLLIAEFLFFYIVSLVLLSLKALSSPLSVKTTAATAMAYYHKYCDVMKDNIMSEKIVLCSAILFLAGKSTENIRGIRGVVNVVRHLYGFAPDSLQLRQVLFFLSEHLYQC